MNDLYPIVSGALSGLAAAGALKGPIESLTQIWTLTIGRFSDNAYQKYKIKQAANLEKYANEVKEKIEKIPEENIQEPKLSVVGPALEASKFYIEEDEIRGMFAKLIASSMDKTQSSNIHPSFVEMIKMLSPLDAKNLYYLSQIGEDATISAVHLQFPNGTFTELYSHVFLDNPEVQDISIISPSIDNLIRLKLVNVFYDRKRPEDALYDKHKNHGNFMALKDEYEKMNSNAKNMLADLDSGKIYFDKNMSPEEKKEARESLEIEKNIKLEMAKGIIELTALGKNFCKVCL